jgi:hypothetical protein
MSDERALGATVALTKGMDAVDLRQVIRQAVDDPVLIRAAQEVLSRQLSEHTAEVWLDVLRQREEVLFGDRDAAQLPRPRVDVSEDEAMERFEVIEVIAPLERSLSRPVRHFAAGFSERRPPCRLVC